MKDHELLARDLTRLGRGIPTARPSAGLATSVLRRVATQPTPVPRAPTPWSRAVTRLRRWLRPWRRRVAVAVLALLVALLATPPVRAAVADWFGFAGVIVRSDPQTDHGTEEEAPPPPEVDDAMSAAEAADLVGFTPLVPAELGEPEAVDVSADRVFASMTWTTDDGPVRLDQFDGRLDWRIAKTSPGVRYADVAGVDALWFDRPHEVVLLGEGGEPRRESARLAGHTLIWPVGELTMRLEGDLSLSRALEIASSAVPYDGD